MDGWCVLDTTLDRDQPNYVHGRGVENSVENSASIDIISSNTTSPRADGSFPCFS